VAGNPELSSPDAVVVLIRNQKNPLLSNTLQRFVRKRWNYGHNFAFLLDSQAKFP